MTANSKIEWTEQTWNPIVGCSIVSPGCTNCYAARMAARIIAMAGVSKTGMHYDKTIKDVKGKPVWTGVINLAPEHVLLAPLRRKKPTTYFVNSMGDLFHEDCPDEWIDKVFAVMALCPRHTFQVLTKRAERMWSYIAEVMADQALGLNRFGITALATGLHGPAGSLPSWPLANGWLGVSCERQQEADERIPLLLQTPAAIRFISAEPLLASIDLTRLCPAKDQQDVVVDALHGVVTGHSAKGLPSRETDEPRLSWVIVGGESGPNARPMHPDWARTIRDQCKAAGVSYFFKQWGEYIPDAIFGEKQVDGMRYTRVGKKRAGRLLDGVEHNEMPTA